MRKQAFDPYRNRGRLKLTRIRREREGRAMGKYMGDYYFTRTTYDLQVLRSKKVLRLTRLRHEVHTYFVMQEIKKLAEQIDDIDAVMRSRKLQTSFLE